jgi:hypothetical protein
MPNIHAHIVVIDGQPHSGRKTLAFELALALLYSQQKTAVLLEPTSPMCQALRLRKSKYPNLPTPEVISRLDFYSNAERFDAIILPEAGATDELSITASTFITLLDANKKRLKDFVNGKDYINDVWELKKKIAATYGHGLNWIVCENNLSGKAKATSLPELGTMAKMYGFRVAPMLNRRQAYLSLAEGCSAQDKSEAVLKSQMTYEDICAKREIIKLAEFIFNS